MRRGAAPLGGGQSGRERGPGLSSGVSGLALRGARRCAPRGRVSQGEASELRAHPTFFGDRRSPRAPECLEFSWLDEDVRLRCILDGPASD